LIEVNASYLARLDHCSMSTFAPFRSLIRALLGASVAIVTASAPAMADALGKALVETNCARCHAIGDHDSSDHPEAPPFRELSKRYPLDALEEAFAEGISVGHPDMPEFIATPRQIEAIIDYLGTLSP
jgi:mono/diheme cytochrome c family protein